MANQIKMAIRDSIYALYDARWSRQRITKELGLDRETVGRQLRIRAAEGSSPGKVPVGIDGAEGAKPAIVPTGIVGRRSTCAGYDQALREGIAMGLTAQRIFQDLRTDHGFTGSYDDVKRQVRRLTAGACGTDRADGLCARRGGPGGLRTGVPRARGRANLLSVVSLVTAT